MPKILVLDQVHEDGLALLRARSDLEVVYMPNPTEQEIAKALPEAEFLLLRGRKLSSDNWQSASRLRFVTRHGVGCDNIDFEVMQQKGVTVAVTADANYISVAEHAFALMLAACKNLLAADIASRTDNWACRDRLGTREVMDAKVLIIGFGRIGQAFGERCLAFGANLLVYDPFLPAGSALPRSTQRVNRLEEGVSQADIISLHLPHTPETANMLGDALLRHCKEGSILVNTGRGGIVDETALLEALSARRPAFYASDVLENEPPHPNHPLLSRQDVIITPHSAAMTAQASRNMALGAAQNVLDFIDGTLSPRMTAFTPETSVQRSRASA